MRNVFAVKTLIVALCALVITTTAGAGAFTKGREIAPLTPAFKPGDYVVVVPDMPAEPGDIVVAKLDRENAATLRKYHSCGEDAAGHPVFDLVPLNADYPTLMVDATNPGRLIAPVFEHHRKVHRGG